MTAIAPVQPAPALPPDRADPLPPLARHALVFSVLAGHVALGWALLQLDAVRNAVREAAPMFVDFLAPPAPPPPVQSEPPPPPPKPVRPPRPKPVLAAAPSPAPPPLSTVMPPEPAPEPPAPEPPAPAPQPPPAPPPEPRTIPPTAVSYLDPPAPPYPAASRRLGEAGRVLLRVEIGPDGRARQVLLAHSSGHARLDQSALAAVRAARFRPYTENGLPLAVWTTVPIVFELEN